jgi:hypothetical protein
VCTLLTKYGTPPFTPGNCAARNARVNKKVQQKTIDQIVKYMDGYRGYVVRILKTGNSQSN